MTAPRKAAAAFGAAAAMLLLTLAPEATAAPQSLIVPAGGPAGSQVQLYAGGLRPGRTATLRTRGRHLARARTDPRGRVTFAVRIPRRARGLVRLATRVRGGVRLVNRFRVSSDAAARQAAELATPAGARVRWSPVSAVPGAVVNVSGAGLPRSAPVLLRFAGQGATAAHTRTTRAGRLGASLRVPSRAHGRTALVVRAGRRALRLSVLVRAERVVAPIAPPPPAGAVSDPSAPEPGPFPQPSVPIRAAFYYGWFPESWSQRGFDPFTNFTPSLGLYDSGDPALVARHVDQLLHGRMEAGIASWWGPGHRTDVRFPRLLRASAGTPLKWAAYYEPEGQGDPTPAQLRDDLGYLVARFASDPAYLRVAGKPVVFVWSDGEDGAAMAARWALANRDLDAYLVLRVFPGYREARTQPDAWHQYAPANPTDEQEGHSFTVSPGFWLRGERRPRLGRDPARFRADVRAMNASNEPWHLVTTFNEWGEGTSVEPAREWPSASGYGTYLDILHEEAGR